MIHLNPKLKEQGLLGTIQKLSWPQTYFTSSINDFLKTKKNVIPTGFSECIFNTLRFGPGSFCFYSGALVLLRNVQYFREEQNVQMVNLDDGNYRLNIDIYDFV